MINFFIIVLILIIFTNIYLFGFRKKVYLNILFFVILLSSTSLIYFSTGNLESFYFKDKLDDEIEVLIKNPEKINEFDTKKLVIFLEEKLEKEPYDLDGWFLLARTCLITGHFQKADKYFESALNYYPDNEKLIFEYSLLKKNTNQFKSAIILLEKLKKINPDNLEGRKLLIELFIYTNQDKKLENDIIELRNNKKINLNWLREIEEKINSRKF